MVDFLLSNTQLGSEFWGQAVSRWAEAPAVLKGLLFFLVWVGLWLPIAWPLAVFVNWKPSQPLTLAQKLPLLASLYLLAPPLIWGLAKLGGQGLADFGLPWQTSVLRSLLLGLLLGSLGLISIFVGQWKLGWLSWQFAAEGEPTTGIRAIGTAILLPLLLGLWVGWTEELIFRGFLLTLFQQDYAPWLAGAIVSFIFALLHLVWEGRQNIPQLPGLWLMGMVLALSRWVDGGNLGLAWGLHAGWVWTIASLDSTQAIRYTGRVSERWTGVAGQPLAGAIGILFMAGMGMLLWVVARL
ncbi:MAG TPA: CPBP family intramembrane glutamic endopeptidase [Coleofasciculaceae cyanobacterium]